MADEEEIKTIMAGIEAAIRRAITELDNVCSVCGWIRPFTITSILRDKSNVQGGGWYVGGMIPHSSNDGWARVLIHHGMGITSKEVYCPDCAKERLNTNGMTAKGYVRSLRIDPQEQEAAIRKMLSEIEATIRRFPRELSRRCFSCKAIKPFTVLGVNAIKDGWYVHNIGSFPTPGWVELEIGSNILGHRLFCPKCAPSVWKVRSP